MYTIEKKKYISPLCILYMLLPHMIPLLKLLLVCTLYEEFTPWEHKTISKIKPRP